MSATAQLWAGLNPIQYGQPTFLNWTTSGVTSGTIHESSGHVIADLAVNPAGQAVVSPPITTTYTLSGAGPNGDHVDTFVTLQVLPAPAPAVVVNGTPVTQTLAVPASDSSNSHALLILAVIGIGAYFLIGGHK